jgi:uncharacterized damage-inducible protein DinB
VLAALSRLLDHLEWADRRVLEGLRADPVRASRARETFAHILGAEHVWLARLRGVPQAVDVWPRLGMEDCGNIAAANVSGYRELLRSLSERDLLREVPYVNSAGQAFRSTIADILLHVVLHGSYHRGQVAAEVRAADGTPVPTDYIAFVRGAPAATRVRPGSGEPR